MQERFVYLLVTRDDKFLYQLLWVFSKCYFL